jgi:WhiB family redox-sensing transcriptional regulator
MTQDWHLDAVCATTDAELWFPQKGDRHTADKAKEFCASCPVAIQCLETALANEEREGIWAGLNGDQLARLRRKKKKVA